jgi:hypothetical protein
MPAQKHLPLFKSTLKTNKTLKTPVSLVLRVLKVHEKRRKCLGSVKLKPQPQLPGWLVHPFMASRGNGHAPQPLRRSTFSRLDIRPKPFTFWHADTADDSRRTASL